MAGTPDAAADPGGAVSTPAPPPASNGVDHGAERTYTVTDTRSAGDAIAGLLYGADDDKPAPPRDRGERAEQPSGGEEPPDTGADEPTGDEGEGQREQPSQAAIAAPASWTQGRTGGVFQAPTRATADDQPPGEPTGSPRHPTQPGGRRSPPFFRRRTPGGCGPDDKSICKAFKRC